jgi:hypothetical protein
VLECFGGAGYVEDTGLPQLLRDSQVLPIWEGTTNVLSLDTLRALLQQDAFASLAEHVREQVRDVLEPSLAETARVAIAAVDHALTWVAEAGARDRQLAEAGARRFALTLGRALALALTAAHAQWSLDVERDRRSAVAARRFCAHGVDQISATENRDDTLALALGEPLA